MGLSDQVTELRAAFDTVQTEIAAAAQRVDAKLAAMQAEIESRGEADPDLSADIQEVRDEVSKLQSIAAEAAPEPEPEPETPVEPSPVEP
jgi:hypothetical protein